MPKTLVFIHGRSQQGKDAAALKAEWIDAWRAGLERAGLAMPLVEAAIRFPYYGDTLAELSSGAAPANAAPVAIRGRPAPEEQDFARDVLEEIAAGAGITRADLDAETGGATQRRGLQNWAWVQAVLRLIDRRVPFASAAAIALFTRDVFHYLSTARVTTAIDAGVAPAIDSDGPSVVVAHSLGTVVAYRLLTRAGGERGWDLPLFVTLGSPLGIRRIRESLAPTRHPGCAQRWFNAFDRRDLVALHPLRSPHFAVDPPIDNKDDVENHTDNRHGIGGYLNDPVVARAIHDAVV